MDRFFRGGKRSVPLLVWGLGGDPSRGLDRDPSTQSKHLRSQVPIRLHILGFDVGLVVVEERLNARPTPKQGLLKALVSGAVEVFRSMVTTGDNQSSNLCYARLYYDKHGLMRVNEPCVCLQILTDKKALTL